MDIVKTAVGCAVVALLAGHQLSTMGLGQNAVPGAAARAAASSSDPVAPTRRDRPSPASPPAAPSVAFGDESIAADGLGQFQTTVEIDGERLPALVDTGATFVSLSADDADRIGVRPGPSDFRYAVSTANGTARVAKVRLSSVRLGGIEVRDVPALVSGPGQLGGTLLGMSFLSRLSSVRIDHGRLLLSR